MKKRNTSDPHVFGVIIGNASASAGVTKNQHHKNLIFIIKNYIYLPQALHDAHGFGGCG